MQVRFLKVSRSGLQFHYHHFMPPPLCLAEAAAPAPPSFVPPDLSTLLLALLSFSFPSYPGSEDEEDAGSRGVAVVEMASGSSEKRT